MSKYFTIAKSSEGIYKEKGSRFLAFAFPANSDAEILERLAELRKVYFDARHHCYAWRLGIKNQTYRVNDDGEPNHSAGDPILGQIKSFELTNVLVVVVRYFGGIKLGVGGLIQAYREAAHAALKDIPRVEVFEKVRFSIMFNYEQTAVAERILSDFEIVYLDRRYETACRFECEVKEADFGMLSGKLEFARIEIDH